MIDCFFFKFSQFLILFNSISVYGSCFGCNLSRLSMSLTGLLLSLIILLSLLGNRDLKRIPSGFQNLTEYITEFIRDLAKTQIGEEEYLAWVPFLGTIFLFIFVSNWSGALLPWRLIELPHGELAAPTNDINTTVALALLTSIAYFYAFCSVQFSRRQNNNV